MSEVFLFHIYTDIKHKTSLLSENYYNQFAAQSLTIYFLKLYNEYSPIVYISREYENALNKKIRQEIHQIKSKFSFGFSVCLLLSKNLKTAN